MGRNEIEFWEKYGPKPDNMIEWLNNTNDYIQKEYFNVFKLDCDLEKPEMDRNAINNGVLTIGQLIEKLQLVKDKNVIAQCCEYYIKGVSKDGNLHGVYFEDIDSLKK